MFRHLLRISFRWYPWCLLVFQFPFANQYQRTRSPWPCCAGAVGRVWNTGLSSCSTHSARDILQLLVNVYCFSICKQLKSIVFHDRLYFVSSVAVSKAYRAIPRTIIKQGSFQNEDMIFVWSQGRVQRRTWASAWTDIMFNGNIVGQYSPLKSRQPMTDDQRPMPHYPGYCSENSSAYTPVSSSSTAYYFPAGFSGSDFVWGCLIPSLYEGVALGWHTSW